VTNFAAELEAAVAKAAEIQRTMLVNEDRLVIQTTTCDGHTHWCASGYGFTASAIIKGDTRLTARTVRKAYRTGIELVDPDGNVVGSDVNIDWYAS
jgi:hypothetical protein